jgi:hypothetical protein
VAETIKWPTSPEFRKTVKDWVQAKDAHRDDLAREFEVAPTTVDRWWLGTATPHIRLQLQVMKWIKSRAA